MPAKHRHLVGWNLRQALFKAAGMSEHEIYGQRAYVWQVKEDHFIVHRSRKTVVATPQHNARLIAVFVAGELAHSWYDVKSERRLWPAYPWRDDDVVKEARKERRNARA